MVIGAGLFVLLLWHYRNIVLLSDWLTHSRRATPPEVSGAWRKIFEGIHGLQRSNRRRRSQLGDMIKRFRQGAEALPDATVVFDADESIVWCNKLAQQQLGIRWPKDQGQRLTNLIRAPEFLEFLDAGDFSAPLEIHAPAQFQTTLEIRIMPYGEGQQLLLARDISHLKRLETMRQDFVANVSHELRTPLTVLQGYLEMMEESELPPIMVDKAHKMMSEQTVRMRGLIEQLLVISRIEGQAHSAHDQVVDVPAMLELVYEEAERLNEDKGHNLNCSISPDLLVFGIEQELRSAVSNLIFNAIHYSPPGSTIKIQWELKNGKATFSVKDNGDGIASEHLSRLTERFYRVDKDRSRKTGGSGLGLAIVKHVLERHGSRLQIKSVVGSGSTFYFRLPEELVIIENDDDFDVEE